jgi:DnaJ family protein A protein 2
MIQQIQSGCEECNGTGEVINAKDRCSNCKGKKVLPEKKILEVHIDKGMKGGQTITFSGESDQSPIAQSGDVVIVIEEKAHDRFKRQENNLITELEIDLLTALAGGQVAIKHLDDRALLIRFLPGEVVKNGRFPLSILVSSILDSRLRICQGHPVTRNAISTTSRTRRPLRQIHGQVPRQH